MKGWRQGFELVPTANWDLATIRTFLLDPVNGNDANQGWSDGAGPYNPATQAKKTTAGIKAVIPIAFAGRKFRLIMAAGTYTDGLDKLIGGITGYGQTSVVRGTATNATAGTTAFADDAADRICQGWITATGMNAAGYNPTGAPTTTVVQCLKVGGAAPAFGAEPALPLGARIRFDSATTTAALRNICRMVSAVSGTDTLTCDAALPAVPVASDTFYLEIGGLALPAHTLSVAPVGLASALQLCGITSTGTITLTGGDFLLVGFKVNALSANTLSTITESSAFTEPTTAGAVTIGGAMRSETTAVYQRGISFQSGQHVSVGGTTLAAFEQAPIAFGAFISGGTLSLGESAQQGSVSAARLIGPYAGLGAITPTGRQSIGGTSVTNAGGKPCIRLTSGSFNFLAVNNTLTGSTGNTDVGLDVNPARGAIIYITSQPTITGTLGDIRVAPGMIISWAQAVAGFVDANGNRFIAGFGAAGPPFYQVARFSGVLITAGGGATTTFAADDSSRQTSNQATAQQFVTSGRLIYKLRLCAPSGTPADSGVTATLYKNGIATAMTCTIAASAAAGTKAIDATNFVIFSDGDTYDVRISGASASNIAFTATLEGP